MLFAEDSLASHSVKREDSKPKTTPDISGRRCLGLSGNAGPLGLLEKMLLDSSDWAWTKYSLTWKAKATPQGRLIFQLARLEPRTSVKGYGLLHTLTAKANQMALSMATRDNGSWGSNLWPTPNAREKGGGEYQDPEKIIARMKKGYQSNLGDLVKLWPTPRVSDTEGGVVKNVELNKGSFSRKNQKGERWGVKLKDAVSHTEQSSGGKLNPLWVAWLMGYPTEYLNSVPWETVSSPKSRKKSDKQ
tara:strand:- start:199 stop:936 length:738 start_codon:yes stop_codon:yes gene_type:complete